MSCLCFVCETRRAKRFRAVGFYQKPGLPVCGSCDELDDNKLLAKKRRREERGEG